MSVAANPLRTAQAGVVPREVTQAKLDRRSAVAAKFRASSRFTLADLLERRTRENPMRVLLRYGERVWTYAEVNSEANRFAHTLHALCVRRGDAVALTLGPWRADRAGE